MASTSETGHAINVANFKTLITICKGYGPKYNPTKAIIKMPALEALHTKATASIVDVDKFIIPYNAAVNEREATFSPLGKLITRVTNSLATSEVLPATVEDAQTIARKLQGKRATPKAGEPPVAPAEGAEPGKKSISASQLSFDSQVANLGKLVELLAGQSAYIPNETELTTATLKALHADLGAKNDKVVETFSPLDNSRIARNEALYSKTDGLKLVSDEVKKYVKSVYGTGTPQFKQVSGLKFTDYKI